MFTRNFEMKFILLIYLLPLSIGKEYESNWTDLDTRILPEWYDKAKIGFVLHWGVFSVPSVGAIKSEWFWGNWKNEKTKETVDFMAKNYPPEFTYQEFGALFTAELFDAKEWANLLYNAGAKYVTLTSKHYDGYTLFPSNRSHGWNSVDVGPHRDVVDELSRSVREKGIKFGVYYGLNEWFNPLCVEDTKANFETRKYIDAKVWPDIKQLINNYKPSLLWVNSDVKTPDKYWNSTDLLAWIYNNSPVKDEIVSNDRWGTDSFGKHGDSYDFEDMPKDFTAHKWERAIQLVPKTYGYRRNLQVSEILTIDDLMLQVVSTVSCGGNAAIHMGPTKEGTFILIYQERLKALGNWLKINGEAIYESSPWIHQNDQINNNVWYTCRKEKYNAARPTATPVKSDNVTAIYAIVLKWPKDGEVLLQPASTTMLLCANSEVKLLGNNEDIEVKFKKGRAAIILPDITTVVSKNAWTLKFSPAPPNRRRRLAGSAARWCNRRRNSGLYRAWTPAFVDIEK